MEGEGGEERGVEGEGGGERGVASLPRQPLFQLFTPHTTEPEQRHEEGEMEREEKEGKREEDSDTLSSPAYVPTAVEHK